MASMTLELNVPAKKLKQLQELVCHFDLRWLFDPYPILPSRPEGEWRVGIDYDNVSLDEANRFDIAWTTLNTPITETVKHYNLIGKVKKLLRSQIPRCLNHVSENI